ncbi:hypothetical protein KAU09_05605 [Candidatus Parcubacteria bacterium]|nr:hypothetical protein [Candidatus Parcubacteria bacterium]
MALTVFFHENPKFLEQLSKYKSYIETSPRLNIPDACWLNISNNDFQMFNQFLGITLNHLKKGMKVKNKKSGNVGIVLYNRETLDDSEYIKIRTDKGYTKWLLKNLEPTK